MAQQQLDRRAAMRARRAILNSSGRFWRPGDLGLPESTAQHLLAALVDRGDLRRIKRGLYWRGTKTPLGMSPPPQEALVKQLAGTKAIGLAGLSAANSLRLSTQVPRRAEYAVPCRAPGPAGAVKFVSRTARKGRTRANLNPTEVAALEVLNDWERVIEVTPTEAMQRLARLVREGKIRPERVARAAITEPGPAKARLKALLAVTHNEQWAAKIDAASPRTKPRNSKPGKTASLAAR